MKSCFKHKKRKKYQSGGLNVETNPYMWNNPYNNLQGLMGNYNPIMMDENQLQNRPMASIDHNTLADSYSGQGRYKRGNPLNPEVNTKNLSWLLPLNMGVKAISEKVANNRRQASLFENFRPDGFTYAGHRPDNIRHGYGYAQEGGYAQDYLDKEIEDSLFSNNNDTINGRVTEEKVLNDSLIQRRRQERQMMRQSRPISPVNSLYSVTNNPPISFNSNNNNNTTPSNFRETIASIESKGSGGYKAQNPKSSAVGKYQFLWKSHGKDIKRVTGVGSKSGFLNNPNAQEKYMNYWESNILTPQAMNLKKYAPNMSLSKLKALIHFKGPGGAKQYLTQGRDSTRRNNISIPSYLSRFLHGGIYMADRADIETMKNRKIKFKYA